MLMLNVEDGKVQETIEESDLKSVRSSILNVTQMLVRCPRKSAIILDGGQYVMVCADEVLQFSDSYTQDVSSGITVTPLLDAAGADTDYCLVQFSHVLSVLGFILWRPTIFHDESVHALRRMMNGVQWIFVPVQPSPVESADVALKLVMAQAEQIPEMW